MRGPAFDPCSDYVVYYSIDYRILYSLPMSSSSFHSSGLERDGSTRPGEWKSRVAEGVPASVRGFYRFRSLVGVHWAGSGRRLSTRHPIAEVVHGVAAHHQDLRPGPEPPRAGRGGPAPLSRHGGPAAGDPGAGPLSLHVPPGGGVSPQPERPGENAPGHQGGFPRQGRGLGTGFEKAMGITPPRIHRHPSRGVFTPDDIFRPLVTARTRQDNTTRPHRPTHVTTPSSTRVPASEDRRYVGRRRRGDLSRQAEILTFKNFKV